MKPETVELIADTRRRLDVCTAALAGGPDCDSAVDAAWHLVQAVRELLPAVEPLPAQVADLTARLGLAHRDPLTGLIGRNAWTDRAAALIASGPAGVVMLDLDSFKPVNDTFGHAAGDQVLIATAQRLHEWCGQDGTAARLGGDEFIAVVTDPSDLDTRVEALQQALTQPILFRDHWIRVGASIGAVRADSLLDPSVSQVLEAADQAMYAVKGRTGRRGWRSRRRPDHFPVRPVDHQESTATLALSVVA
ncbi:GGDEF domain-containing protein [Streptomyces sp. NPDC048527]|uniref:GGDEF domain-containing protein n=1 Tax=Streptomyces sp. NPDC048527 TaxID=3365568 RepID=UPI00371E15F1